MLKSVKFGAKYTDHNRELIFNATTYGGFHVPINTTPASAFAGGPTPSDFLDSIDAPGTLTRYWQVDRSSVDSILFANLATSGRVFYPQQNFSVTEKATAGYAMANFQGDRWRGNLGTRFVRTEQIAEGALINPSGGAVQNPFGNFDPIRATRTYNDVLPSLNVVYDLAENTLLRFAVAKVMARPDYTDIAPRVNLNIGALSGSAGNPDLDPYRATQADFSIEFYPNANTAYAFGVYYKDVKSFITDSLITQSLSGAEPDGAVAAMYDARHEPLQLSVRDQSALERRRRLDQGRGAVDHAARLRRLRRADQLHVGRGGGRQRRPAAAELEEPAEPRRRTSRTRG